MPGNAYDMLKYWVIQLLVLYDAVLRRLRPHHPSMPRVISGLIRTGSRPTLCVFAHYDRDGIIDDYVVRYLSELDSLGCEIVFVSSAPSVSDAQIDKVKPYCAQIVLRENIGYDFASWRDGLACCEDLSRFERVIIANDSVYGPLTDLRPAFDAMATRQTEVWGITDSMRYGRHLQSYFLVFGRAAVQSGVFRKFWQELPDYRFKHVVIMRCEVGLSRRLHAAGFELVALYDYRGMSAHLDNVVKTRSWRNWPGAPVNMTHWGWRALLEAGSPFLKVQLLRDNPKKVDGVREWAKEIRNMSSYDIKLIEAHLRRICG